MLAYCLHQPVKIYQHREISNGMMWIMVLVMMWIMVSVMMWIMVLGMMPFTLLGGLQRFRGAYRLHLTVLGRIKFLRSVDNHVHAVTTQKNSIHIFSAGKTSNFMMA
jgi:hypothetical protein